MRRWFYSLSTKRTIVAWFVADVVISKQDEFGNEVEETLAAMIETDRQPDWFNRVLGENLVARHNAALVADAAEVA